MVRPRLSRNPRWRRIRLFFDTDFDKYTEDAVALFGRTGANTAFEKLEGFPEEIKKALRIKSALSEMLDQTR
ncbi:MULTISPECIES: hypothetical protein [Streptomyces]|uniref:Uncharacterized protein n=1 Tax=Streptomyces flaveolus TaxID=67297 RepID=A0ABV3A7Z4_9ACTN|nr:MULTISPECIES: hypothetical protein [Streptomyces]KMS70254.1 hypothetical protein ACZ91_66130 [Streptomyces regensis]KOG72514.1 hypothetical protein ADK77_10415 [Streptomyces antibioticus]